MAGSRKQGSLGMTPEVHNLNDGTMVRGLSPRPGTIGAPTAVIASLDGSRSVPAHMRRTSRNKAAQSKLQILRQGSQGPEVRALQRLINARLAPAPNLAIDGVFNPAVNQAVLQYQKGVAVPADGIVGKQTWYHLLKGERVTVGQASIPSLPPATAAGVWEWPLTDKFTEVLRRTGPKLPGSMQREFGALLSPASLEILAGTLVVWAGSHAFGVGEVVDIVLLAGGVLCLGLAVFDVAGELGDFLVVTSTATDEKDLDEAASHLAVAIAILGVAAFIALLAKVARVRSGRGGGSEAPPELEPERAPPKSRKPHPEPKPAERPKQPPGKSPTELQLDEVYAKAPAAKNEIDAIARRIADQTGGRVAEAPLKGRARALEKVVKDYKGNISELKDIARNTVVVEKNQYEKAVALLEKQGAKVRKIDPASDPLGYSGANGIIKTKAGMPAEIQVNTPEMIFAKESPANARTILGEEKYAEIAAKTGVPGGRGHLIYEEYRSLPAGEPARAARLETESRAYYDQIRSTGGQ